MFYQSSLEIRPSIWTRTLLKKLYKSVTRCSVLLSKMYSMFKILILTTVQTAFNQKLHDNVYSHEKSSVITMGNRSYRLLSRTTHPTPSTKPPPPHTTHTNQCAEKRPFVDVPNSDLLPMNYA
jgi:hypothetical protein